MAAACHFCGSEAHETVSEKDRHGNPLRTVLCVGCGIITNDPIPNAEQLERFYRVDYRVEYKGAAEPRMRQIWRNFDRLEKHFKAFSDLYIGRKTALDLGSGSGEFTFLASQVGIDCIGIEPNEQYAEFSREKFSANVTTQTLEDCDFEAGQFDLIRLSHVLEHMREPIVSLKTLKGWLSTNGLLYIEVPNIEQDARNRIRGKLFHYGHIYNFNPETLRLAAHLAGLEEIESSKARLGHTTAGFFRVAEKSISDSVDLPANASKMRAAMVEHNSRSVPKPLEGSAVSRLFKTLGLRLHEVTSARKFSSYREIADQSASTVRGYLDK